MSQILFQMLQNDIFKTDAVREISKNAGKPNPWIFDFKGQALSTLFLKEYASHFWESFKGYSELQIGGMETGAIPLIIGLTLFAPEGARVTNFYIRKSRKKSDLANQVEGTIDPTKSVILVDDILNSGSTVRKQIAILEELGCPVAAIFVCLRFRDLSEYQDLLDKGIRVISIFDLNDFKEVLPVENLKREKMSLPHSKYQRDYKITLTNKPNYYMVLPKSGPLLHEAYIYIGVDDGTFYCVSKSDGVPVWTYTVPFGAPGKRIFSTPAVWGDVVMFGAYDGNFYCLDRFTGKRKWVFTDADWIGSSPCLDTEKGVVFIGLEFGLFSKQGGVAALDIKTGKPIWKEYLLKGYTHASPAFDPVNNIVVCGCNDTFLYAFNAKDGKLLWKFKTNGEIKYGAVFDPARSLVAFGSMDGGLYVVHTLTGELYHRFEARFGFYSTPAIQENRLIIGSLDKTVYCFNIETKNTEWAFETNGRIFSSPVIEKESVFIGSNDGKLYELNVSTGKPVTTIQFTERIVNRIQLEHADNGKRVLYIPTHAGELYKMSQLN